MVYSMGLVDEIRAILSALFWAGVLLTVVHTFNLAVQETVVIMVIFALYMLGSAYREFVNKLDLLIQGVYEVKESLDRLEKQTENISARGGSGE